ncbi:MAG: 50S ribosomal protein L24 [Phycisphaerae bacterium]
MACKIRRDDIVEVISGDHKGARGKVLRVVPEGDVVYVEGVNLVYRHVRPTRRNPQGGRLQKEAPIHVSKVLPVDPKTGRGARVRFEVQRDDSGRVVEKRRVTTGGSVLGVVSQKSGES